MTKLLAWLSWVTEELQAGPIDPVVAHVVAVLLSMVFAAGLLEFMFLPRPSGSLLKLPGWRVVFFQGTWPRFSTPGYLLLIPAVLGYGAWSVAAFFLLAGLLAELARCRIQQRYQT